MRLIEGPSSWNDYTAVIRIDDGDHMGDSYYEFELTWNERDPWDDFEDAEINIWGREDDQDWDRSSDWDGEGGAFRWEGRVDIGAEIRIRGGEHEVDDAGGQGTQEYQSRFTSDLPEAELPVSLRQLDGRGRVELIQTPSAENDYTAVVRIEDSKSGDDTYQFELTWGRY